MSESQALRVEDSFADLRCEDVVVEMVKANQYEVPSASILLPHQAVHSATHFSALTPNRLCVLPCGSRPNQAFFFFQKCLDNTVRCSIAM